MTIMTVLLRVFEYSQFFFYSNLEFLYDTYNLLYLEKPANVFEQYQNIVCELYFKKLRIIIQKKNVWFKV